MSTITAVRGHLNRQREPASHLRGRRHRALTLARLALKRFTTRREARDYLRGRLGPREIRVALADLAGCCR
jgi:hypothetical protein